MQNIHPPNFLAPAFSEELSGAIIILSWMEAFEASKKVIEERIRIVFGSLQRSCVKLFLAGML